VNKAIAWKMYQGENPIKQVKLPVLKCKNQALPGQLSSLRQGF